MLFDIGYIDYLQYHNWPLADIYFVTRQKDNPVYQSLEEFPIGDHIHSGVLNDGQIEVLKDKQTITLCRVAFYNAEQGRVYEFISNNFELAADKIAEIYKQRCQIKTLFI